MLPDITTGNTKTDGQDFHFWFVGRVEKWCRENNIPFDKEKYGLRSTDDIEIKWGISSELCKWDFKYYAYCGGVRQDTHSYELDRILRDGFDIEDFISNMKIFSRLAKARYEKWPSRQ